MTTSTPQASLSISTIFSLTGRKKTLHTWVDSLSSHNVAYNKVMSSQVRSLWSAQVKMTVTSCKSHTLSTLTFTVARKYIMIARGNITLARAKLKSPVYVLFCYCTFEFHGLSVLRATIQSIWSSLFMLGLPRFLRLLQIFLVSL